MWKLWVWTTYRLAVHDISEWIVLHLEIDLFGNGNWIGILSLIHLYLVRIWATWWMDSVFVPFSSFLCDFHSWILITLELALILFEATFSHACMNMIEAFFPCISYFSHIATFHIFPWLPPLSLFSYSLLHLYLMEQESIGLILGWAHEQMWGILTLLWLFGLA